MNAPDLDAIEQRYLATTRSQPWTWNGGLTVWSGHKDDPDADVFIATATSVQLSAWRPPASEQTANAIFIAAAHEAIPQLLAEVRQWRHIFANDCLTDSVALRQAYQMGMDDAMKEMEKSR